MSPLLKRSFDPAKCKTLLQLAVQRIKLLRNKKSLANKKLRGEIAKLVEKGQDSNASLQVETLFREENLVTAYDLLEQYCQMVISQLPAMKSQKVCPPELKEPVASLIYCASLCKELLELQKLKKIFKSKYGSEFSHAAIELRPDCGVNSQIIQKLSTVSPNPEMKLKLLKNVAQEHNIDWKYANESSDTVEVAVDTLNAASKSSDAKVLAEISTSSTPKTPDYVIEHKSFSNFDKNRAALKLNDENMKVAGHEVLDLKTATEVAYVSASQAAEAAKAAFDMIIKKQGQGWKVEADLDTKSKKIETTSRSEQAEDKADQGGVGVHNGHVHMSDEMLEQIKRPHLGTGNNDVNSDGNFSELCEKNTLMDTPNESSIYVVPEISKSNHETEKIDTFKAYEEHHISESDPEMPNFDDYESDPSFEEEKYIHEHDKEKLFRLNHSAKSPSNYCTGSANDYENNVSTETRNVVNISKSINERSPKFDDFAGLESPNSVRQNSIYQRPKSYTYPVSVDDALELDTANSIRQNTSYYSKYTSPKSVASSVSKPQYDDYTEVEDLSYWSSPVREYTNGAKSYQDRKPPSCKKLTWHSRTTQESESIPEDHESYSPLSSEEQFSHKETMSCDEGPSPVDKNSIHAELDSHFCEPVKQRLRWKSRSTSEDSVSIKIAPVHLNEDEKRATTKHDDSPRVGKLEHQVSSASKMSYHSLGRSVRSTRSRQSPSLVSPTYSEYENIYSPIGGR